ncbi:9885_t:CDS:1 [Gigaspora margarita]|uniref:Endoplasmic reticulum junction formation protein lunapark n=1 Tax=Gigaspora margarita TaxID=4874 RepID=A0ABN7WJT0_GIGMA|nr:9885_t:CDS:1 [Gigaspora margarita]
MGAVVSRLRSKKDDNYEEILSELDEKIRRADVNLREIRIRERNALIIWIVYSLIAYVTYVVGYWYFVYMSVEEDGWDLMKVTPVLTGPFFIVIGYKFLALWYKRKEANEETQLEHLRAKKKLKVEEMKNKTGYYTTQNLLERFDSKGTPNQPNNPLSPGQKGPIGRPVLPISPNLRQRLPNLQASPGSNEVNGELENRPPLIAPGGHDIIRSDDRSTIISPTALQRRWYDKLLDVLVGEEEQKYALICKNCYTWNGLALPTEFDDVQYYCKNCNHFNPSRRSQRDGNSLSAPPNNVNGNNVNSHIDQINKTSQLIDSDPKRGRSTTPKPMSRNSSFDSEKPNDKGDDYDDDGVAVSKRLASRSTSRKRRSSRSQNRIESHHDSDDQSC